VHTTADVVHTLDRLGLVEPGRKSQLETLQNRFTRTEDFVRELVHEGYLSVFQATKIQANDADGLRVGEYVLVEEIGGGGMGRIFKGIDPVTKHIVCLKIIRDELKDSKKLLKRFEREWKAASRLSHPNIVAAYSAGEQNDSVYYAMEFVDGIDLGRLVLDRGALPVREAMEYMVQAARALQHAHDHGLIHRDIKPDNFLLDESRRLVKLLDLGLCRVEAGTGEDAATALTVRGTAIGTPEYMAPEQIRDATSVDTRADLYSLGCTFYYLLTGQDPFRGKSPMDVMLMQVKQEPTPIEQLQPAVPKGVIWAVSKLMKKKREERMQTAGELANYLEQMLSQPEATWNVVPKSDAVMRISSASVAKSVPPQQMTKSAAPGIGPRGNTPMPHSRSGTLPAQQPHNKPARPRPARRGVSVMSMLMLAVAATVLGSLVAWYALTRSALAT
jgi:serine/threonine protein kinase